MRATSPSPHPALARADWLIRPETQAVFAVLQGGGHGARAVGGAVRNALMGRQTADVDIATTARPEDVVRLVVAAGMKAIPTGLAHGTVTVIAGQVAFEVTTLRRDVATDGRRATVAFTDDWAHDASRRDFTINALSCDATGVLHDPLGGYGDVVARRVRFIGRPEDRIREDYLRILRFFRFHAAYASGPMDAAGLSAAVALRSGLSLLSGERIHQELVRLVTTPGAAAAIRELCETGLLLELLGMAPYPATFARMQAVEAAVGVVPSPMLRLAALLVATTEDAGRLSERLKVARIERDTLLRYAVWPSTIDATRTPHAARRALYHAASVEAYRESVRAAWVRAGEPAEDERWAELHAVPDRWSRPEFPLRGTDVLALGIAAGPRVGELLARVEVWWEETDFSFDRSVLLDRLAEECKRP